MELLFLDLAVAKIMILKLKVQIWKDVLKKVRVRRRQAKLLVKVQAKAQAKQRVRKPLEVIWILQLKLVLRKVWDLVIHRLTDAAQITKTPQLEKILKDVLIYLRIIVTNLTLNAAPTELLLVILLTSTM